ncbi:Protein-disulfide isomerase [Thermomonospora echinospora]|uniref:Protein-disulfide isomerase n=1 Tax=Thermomonospora echinospora TaxID=1992 RepID=A0A1H5SS48_9ACTN|nr:thioredoxin domain-containing protein [Thermomonospora echinospora]SEF53240.1 Protein-disulfide isomerase [Thermomonospora echinospora]
MGRNRRDSARKRMAELRAREAARAHRRRALATVLGALVVIAVTILAVVLLRGGENSRSGYRGSLAPLTRQADGSVVMARPGVSGPVLEIYEDFQCPACKSMEEATGKTVKELAAAGEAKVVYRPFWLFRNSPEPTRGNSLRALNASLCAPADTWIAYHDRLFAEQGPENSPGFRDEDLISWARQVGIGDGGFASCVTGVRKSAQIDQADAAATKAGVQSTPWVTLNGRRLDQKTVFTPDGLRRAVREVAR